MNKVKQELKHYSDHNSSTPRNYEPENEMGRQMQNIFELLFDCSYTVQREFLVRAIETIGKSFDARFQKAEKDVERAGLKMKELHEMHSDYHSVINSNELQVSKSH